LKKFGLLINNNIQKSGVAEQLTEHFIVTPTDESLLDFDAPIAGNQNFLLKQ
jgi:hypothetical protein